MTKLEKKIWGWVTGHPEWVLAVCGTLLSFLIRYWARNFISGDMETYLIPWYEEIRTGGGLAALKTQVGNYNIPYQVLIGVLTYLPIRPEYAYKLLSFVFDYLLAAAVGRLVWLATDRNRMKAVMGYTAAVLLPQVFMNSAMWGQCDSIYTFFCVLAVILLFREKSGWAMAAYGAALAFKLQAVFLLPFLLFYYVREQKFSCWKFLLAPATVLVLCLPALVQGRPVKDIITIYHVQTLSYPAMSFNYAGFWTVFLTNMSGFLYEHFRGPAIALTVGALGMEMLFLLRNRVRYNRAQYIVICMLTAYTCVMFLPSMHDRYDYLPLTLALVIALCAPETGFLYVAFSMVHLRACSAFLLGQTVNWTVLSAIHMAVFAGYAWCAFRMLKKERLCP